jgi:hypothetical protein
MQLHTPITRGSKRDYCGPTAMAAVTGLPLKNIREAIIEQRDYRRVANGQRYLSITGLSPQDLLGAMDLLGWRLVERDDILQNRDLRPRLLRLPKLMTLAEFCEQRGNGGPYIVSAGHHWQAISAGEFCDTFTMTPISIEIAMRPGKGRAGKWVKGWYRFDPIIDPTLPNAP